MKKLLILIICFAFLIALSSSAYAVDILFQDNFNDGDDEGWSVIEGTWTVVDGVYVAPDPGGWNLAAKSIVGEEWWSNYTFEGRFMLTADAHEASLLFRVQWALPGINHGKFYQIFNAPGVVSLAEMYGVAGGANVIGLKVVAYSLERNKWYNFRIVLNGPSMEYYIDDDLVMSYDSLTSYLTGKIGLKTAHYGQTYFDDILVYAAPPPPPAVGGKATPINMPMNNIELLAPYLGLTILLAVAVIAVGYVKKRKRKRI